MNAFSCFLMKCFTVNSLGSKSSATSPFPRLDSHFPLVLRCIRDLSVYLSFAFSSSQAFTALGLLSLSVSVFFSFSFSSCRAHNCITERLSSLSLPILSSRSVYICRSQNKIVSLVRIYNGAEGRICTTEVDTNASDKTCSNQRIHKLERALLIDDKNVLNATWGRIESWQIGQERSQFLSFTINHSVSS